MFFDLAITTLLLLSQKGDASQESGYGNPDPRNTWKLAEDLMKGYNSKVDPGHITVRFGILLNQADLDLEENVLRTVVWERMEWKDIRLTWNPAEYGGISVIRFPNSEVWKPDIKLFNQGFETTKGRDMDTNVIIQSTGEVLWMPPASYSTQISVDKELEEFVAYMKFGSWTYDGFYLNLTLVSEGMDGVDTSGYLENDNFELVASDARIVTKLYACCPEPYQDFQARITFKRRNTRW